MVLASIVSIVFLGISAQWLAWRLRIPSILLLLLFGFLAGPMTGFLNPDELLGEILFPWVSLSVAIILFEGGLSLKFSELAKIGKVVRNLVTVGMAIGWTLTSVAAWHFLDIGLSLSILLGAILVVTGPTVIVPMIRQLRLSVKLSSILKWEAMLIDPIGAILAVLTFEAILMGGFQVAAGPTMIGMMKTIVIGAGLGGIFTWMMRFALKRYWIPDFLQSSVTLMFVLSIFSLSNMMQAESGLVAVTIAGILLANQKDVAVKHIIEFKENLRVVLISSLFIVLGARLNIESLAYVGKNHFMFICLLILFIRPIAVFFSTLGSNLHWKERLFLSWMAPRGIVAAAIASVFALHLSEAGHPKAERLLDVTFLVIIATVTVYGITAPWLARVLKVAQPNPQGVLIAGGHGWARQIALALKERGFLVSVMDTNWANVQAARLEGLPAVRADILDSGLLDEMELSGFGHFLALTSNDEVNSLAAIHFSEYFGRSEIYQLPLSEKRKQARVTGSKHMQGRLLFSERTNFLYLEHLFEQKGEIRQIPIENAAAYENFKKKFGESAVVLFVVTSDKKTLKVMTIQDPPVPKEGQFLLAWIAEK